MIKKVVKVEVLVYMNVIGVWVFSYTGRFNCAYIIIRLIEAILRQE